MTEPTATSDGLEQLRCSCGAVEASATITKYVSVLRSFYSGLKDAPLNGVYTLDTFDLYTISDEMIKKLAERADLTTVVSFEYNHERYSMTIPAGVDYTKLLEDEDRFYGYFYFASLIDAAIEKEL